MAIINNYLTHFRVSNPEGQIGESCELSLETLGGGYTLDLDFQVEVAGSQRDFFISHISKELRAGEWEQSISGDSPIVKLIKKSPKKKLIYITMSQEEYSQWLIDNSGRERFMDYVPLIKIGNEFGEYGWSASEIIKDLASRAGITLQLSIPDYSVQRLEVDSGTTFLNAVLGLVSSFEPFVYALGGMVFILEDSAMERSFISGNQFSLTGARLIREELRRKDKPSQIRLTGALGRFRRDHYKGFITSNPYQLLQETVGSSVISNYAYGFKEEKETIEIGTIAFILGMGLSTYDAEGWSVNAGQEEVTLKKGYDIFGNPVFDISETRSVYRWRSGRPTLFSQLKSATQYQGTDGFYNSSREYGAILGKDSLAAPSRIESLSQWAYTVSGGQVVYQFINNLSEKKTYYWYLSTGELFQQVTAEWGWMYSEDGQTEWRPLQNLKKENLSPGGTVQWKLIQQEVVIYRQRSKDSYSANRELVRLDPSGVYKREIRPEIVQAGAVQGSKLEPRTMQVYAETGAPIIGATADMNAVMATPAQEISINTPSWEALKSILPLFQKKLTRDEIVRTYELHGELNVHLGLAVQMPQEVNLDASETIPAPALDSDFLPMIIGYDIEKDMNNNRAVTRLIVKGRLL